MNEFIARNQLQGVNVYLDNLTVGGVDQRSHNQNLKALKEAAQKEQFTFNEDKCQYNCSQIQLVGHVVGNGVIKPDPERVVVLDDLKPPQTKKSYKGYWVYSVIMQNGYLIFLLLLDLSCKPKLFLCQKRHHKHYVK